MYAVRLLPIEYRDYQRAMRRSDKLVFVGIIAVLALLVVLVTSMAISSILAKELDGLRAENIAVNKQIDELKSIEELQLQVAGRLEQIEQTAGLSPNWDQLIAAVGNSSLPGITFDSVDLEYGDQSGTMVIQGSASGHDDVSALLRNLSKVDGLGDIQCRLSSATDSELVEDVRFEIRAEILVGAPYQIPTGGAE
jgi:Tfp pilus assembly protein PilN